MADIDLSLLQQQLARLEAENRAAGPAQTGLATGGSGPRDPGMEPRVAKLEADVGHIQRDVSEIKLDIRELRKVLETDFRLLFGALIVATLGLAAIMAKGFHWL